MAADSPVPGVCQSKLASIAAFDPVDDKKEINTQRFLAACNGIASILSDLGNAFSFPKKDMLGNIKKIQDRYQTDKEKYITLNKMMEEDSIQKKKQTTTVVAIIWLMRGLDFLHALLSNISQEFKDQVVDENLRATILKAYESALKQYHGSMVQFVVTNTFRFSPYRSVFLKTLAVDPSVTHEMVISDIDDYLINFSATINLIRLLLDEHDLNLSLTA